MAAADEVSMLSGRVHLEELPPLPRTEIKVYICSNAEDMQVEQTAFVAGVYPKLRSFCRSKYGIDFHGLDSRWSAMTWVRRSDSWVMHQAIINECRRKSAGPFFVGLIGQRLGDCSLPSFIPAEGFEVVRQVLSEQRGRLSKLAPLLDNWYIRDDNDLINPSYVLQRLHNDSLSSATPTPIRRLQLRRNGGGSGKIFQESIWDHIQGLLRQLLHRGIDLCLQDGTIATRDNLNFLITDFERELNCVLDAGTGSPSDCLVFFRTIIDLKNYLSLPVSQKFAVVTCADDPEEKPRLDEESQRRLTSLRDKITARVPAKQCVSSSLLWKHDGGIDAQLHRDYLDNITQAFQAKMEEMVNQMPEVVPAASDNVLSEVHQHWILARDLVRHHVGMGQLLDLVRSYVVSNDDKPLVVFGEAGTGKSSALAKAASEANQWINDIDTISVIRFLGVTTQSRDTRQTLLSLCRQILGAMGRNQDAPTSYPDLVSFFFEVLDGIPEDMCLVIFLDSVESLQLRGSTGVFDWIPQRVKENVKVVLSVNTGSTLETLRNDVIRRSNNFVEMPSLVPEECGTLLRAFLEEENRKLTEEQESAVFEKCFAYCASPLLVKMVSHVVSRWTSTTEVDLVSIPDSVGAGVEGILTSVERMFGEIFVGRVLAVLTASQKGLTDCEMEDLLSLDNSAFESFDEGTEGPKRIPPMAWQRVKYELRRFLRPVVCEGATLVYWGNSIFEDTARSRYLADEKTKQEVHSLIAGYWMGWKTEGMNPTGTDDDRFSPDQPLMFREPDPVTHPLPLYNLRKFDQLPVHLSLAGRQDELNRCVLFRFEWLYHKTKAFSLEHVISDYGLGKGLEVELVGSALRDAASYINENPDNMAAELTGRLLGYYSNHNNIRDLIGDCDRLGVDHCALVPNFPYRQIPGGALMFVIECDDCPTECAIVGDEEDIFLAKNSSSPHIEVIDLVTGKRQGGIPTSVGSMYVSQSGRHAAVVDYEREKSIKLHCLETGKFLGHLVPVNHISLTTKDKQQLTHLRLSDDYLCLAIAADTNWLCIADVKTCTMSSVLNLPKGAVVCEMTPDSRHVFVNTGTTLLSYDLKTTELVNNTIFEEVPRLLTFTKDSRLGFVVGEQANKLMKITLNSGKIEFQVKIDLKASLENDFIEELQLSKSQELLLLRCHSNLIIYHVIDDRLLCHIERPKEVPLEFRLPKSSYSELRFSRARFTGDDQYLAAIIFRDVLIYQVGSGCSRLVSTIRTPIGLIQNLYTTNARGQLVTISQRSKQLHVWSLQDSLNHVDALDRLTSPINRIVVTENDSKAFVTCTGSDEIGIIDMRSGNLVDLLTHEAPVVDFSVSATGEFAIVALELAKPGQFNKLWNVTERRVTCEFGSASSVSLFSSATQSFLCLVQATRSINDPFHLSLFKSGENGYEEIDTDLEVSYVLQQPFLTADDQYVVVLSAEEFDHSRHHYINPCICAVSLKTAIITMTTFTTSGLRDRVTCLRRILHIRPCPTNPYTVIVLYTNEPDLIDGRRSYDHNYGFMILDLCSAVICQLIDDFLLPTTPLAEVLFTRDIRLCVDHLSHVYDMANGHCLVSLLPTSARPQRLAMDDSVVIYGDGQYLMVVRLADWKCLGRLSVHGDIRVVEVCRDGRTLVVGCTDGSVVSHVIVDVDVDDRSEVIGQLATRKSWLYGGAMAARYWDKVNVGAAPGYARPPSAVASGGLSEKQLLQGVKPFAKVRSARPQSSSHLYGMSYGSQTCVTM